MNIVECNLNCTLKRDILSPMLGSMTTPGGSGRAWRRKGVLGSCRTGATCTQTPQRTGGCNKYPEVLQPSATRVSVSLTLSDFSGVEDYHKWTFAACLHVCCAIGIRSLIPRSILRLTSWYLASINQNSPSGAQTTRHKTLLPSCDPCGSGDDAFPRSSRSAERSRT